MKKIFKQAGLASLLVMAMANAMAVPSSALTGQWTITFYNEPNLTTGATQKICFKSDGTWFSTTVTGWNGDWLLKGDRLRWYGDTSGFATAEFGQFSSIGRMSGEFAHFNVPGTPPVTSSRGNYFMTKTSSTCTSTTATTATLSQSNGDPAAH